MSEYIVEGAEPNNTVLKSITPNGYEHESWLPVREEIVRCRDCKCYHPKEGKMLSCRFEYKDFVQWRYAEPDGYCWKAERKVDA